MKTYNYRLTLLRVALLILGLFSALPVHTTAWARIGPHPLPKAPVLSPELSSRPQSKQERERAELLGFIAAVKDPQRKALPVGVFSPGVLSNPVVQQPASKPVFVSTDPQALTQFRRASQEGSLGLLAHNTLAGKLFYQLETGDKLFVIYGDGHFERYVIYNFVDYRAVTPRLFEELKTGKRYSDYQVFYRVYTGEGNKLVLQTCLEKNGRSTWGRRFIFAMRVDSPEQAERTALKLSR